MNHKAETATPRRLHDDIAEALKTLGVVLAPGALDMVLSAAERESLSHLEFLHRLLAGPAEAKRQRALERRIRVTGFRELITLEGFDWEFNAKGDGSFAGMLKKYAQFDLLLIDEFGFDRLEHEAQAQASTFYYRLLDTRTGWRSTVLATNIDFTAWADYLGDPRLATAFLNRLVDGALILKLIDRSYRAHRARPVLADGQANRS